MNQLCLRWDTKRSTFRRPTEVIRTAEYDVASIADDTAPKAFITEHHYSGSYPAALHRFGLYRRAALVGVAVFSQPMTGSVLELGRFVLLDEVPGNGETWFLARAFDVLRERGIPRVVSFSDPTPRTRADGSQVFPGHVGTIYQAFNGTLVGRSCSRTHRLLPDGRLFSPRTMQKIRARERGVDHAAQQLVDLGAEPLRADEDSAAWLKRWLPALTRPLRHPGNWKYLWGLTRAERRMLPASLPYPKKDSGRPE